MTGNEWDEFVQCLKNTFPDIMARVAANTELSNSWFCAFRGQELADCKAGLYAIFQGRIEKPFWDGFPAAINKFCDAKRRERERLQKAPYRIPGPPNEPCESSMVEAYQFMRAKLQEGVSLNEARRETFSRYSF